MFTKRVLITLASATLITIGSILAIHIAKGYRPTRDGKFQGTGLLAANSFPNGAQVYLNGKLTTATDNTLNLNPAEYDVEIKKDGYIPWKKHLRIEKELVTQTNAMLFPSVPSLSPLTFTGASNIVPSPDGQKIVFYVASASAQTKNGLYVLDLTDNFLSLQKGARKIASEARGFDLAKAKFLWSPDSTQLLVSYDGHNVLLDAGKNNSLGELSDVTYSISTTFTEWEEELHKREHDRLAKFPVEIQRIATASAKDVYISPDEDRVLYTATKEYLLPETIIPPVQASNTQQQDRKLQVNGIYVYDRKEDRNFRVGTSEEEVISPVKTLPASKTIKKINLSDSIPTQTVQGTTIADTIKNFQRHYTGLYTGNLQWFPDSKHLLGIQDNAIFIKEYDNTNEVSLYAGSLSEQFVYPWPNGSKLIILTNFNQNNTNMPVNLYAINLK